MNLPLNGTFLYTAWFYFAEYFRYFPFELSVPDIEVHVILIITLKEILKITLFWLLIIIHSNIYSDICGLH